MNDTHNSLRPYREEHWCMQIESQFFTKNIETRISYNLPGVYGPYILRREKPVSLFYLIQ